MMGRLSVLVEEVHALIVSAALDEVARESGLVPSLVPRGWVPGVSGPSDPSEGLTEALDGDGW